MGRVQKEKVVLQAAPAPRTARTIWFAIAVAALTFVVFIPSIAHPFVVWDDEANFVDNPAYRGLSLTHLRWMFTTFHLGPYQPLSWITLGLDFELWGMNATGYHLTNVVLHALAAALLCALSIRLCEMRAGTASRNARFFGIAVTLLWAVHPLRVEGVSWVTERREVLSGALFFATLLAAARGARWWWITALALLAMLAKATTVVLAPLLILLDLYAGRETDARSLFNLALQSARRHALVIVLAGVFAAVAILGQRTTTVMVSTDLLGIGERLRFFGNSLSFYVAKTVWPFGIAPMYDPPMDRSELTIPSLLGALGLVVALVFTWRARAKLGHLWTLPLAYFVLLLPIGGLVQVGNQIAADRYSYQPGAVITMMLAAFVGGITAHKWTPSVRAGVLALVCAGLGWRCVELQAIWGSSRALWEHQLREYPDTPVAHLHLGLLQVEGKFPESTTAEAEAHFRAAINRSPNFGNAWCALGDLQARAGRLEEAAQSFRTAIQVQPGNRPAQQGLAHVAWYLKRPEETLAALRRLSELDPANYRPRMLLGRALAALGKPREAILEYERALSLTPGATGPLTELAKLLATHPDASVRDGRRALQLAEAAARSAGGSDTDVMQARISALAEVGRFTDAVALLAEARRTLPDANVAVLDGLMAQFKRGEALRVPPGFP